jgi:hypothetical protein
VLYSTKKVFLRVTHETTPRTHDNVLTPVLRLILLVVTLVTALGIALPQEKRGKKRVVRQASVASGKETFSKVLHFLPRREWYGKRSSGRRAKAATVRSDDHC